MRFRYSQNNGRLEKKAVVYSQNEHKIDCAGIDGDAALLCKRLQQAGYETYIVGGAVRDLLLGSKPKDFDIATSARPQEIKRLIRNSRLIGRRFKLIHVFFPSKIIEVATFRSMADGTTGNTFGSIEDDVMRRDFTMNALFYDPVKELVIDYVGGVEDINRKLLKPVIPLGVIFKDDPVRMIRAVKYCAIANWDMPQALAAKIRANGALLAQISPSRLTEEITKMIKSPAAARIAQSLEEAGLYRYMQPAASALIKKDAAFKNSYYKRFTEAHEKETAPEMSSLVFALVADYVERETDWAQNGAEDAAILFREIFAKARHFVLPMNPPRIELERAIRQLFAEHGIALKKLRLGIFTRRRAGTAADKDGTASGKGNDGSENAAEGLGTTAVEPAGTTAKGAPKGKKRRNSGSKKRGKARRKEPDFDMDDELDL
ncbi:MAG: polynucleotide adenylyltransferase PcnB [Spirochaetaceae bacterium]|nr:polynucleotide adenylyltransferase PcnB [Spirochaetaceae bacterium]